LLGVTATPVRGDGQGLGVDAGGIFDALVLGPSTRELMDMGNLVEPIVYAPSKTLDLSSVKIRMGDYDKKELAKAVDKPTVTGDAVAHYTKLCPRVPAVAFCVSVSHAEHVATEFRDAGYVAYSVDGSMDDDTRSRILAGLGNGSVHVVTSCDLISEGTDIPAIGCAILLRPTKSEGLYLQQVGRALRPYAGKTTTIILDHVGNTLLHGLPDQHRDWSLDGNKKKKKKGEQEKSLAVAQCPACYAIHAPAPACPVCGHVVPAPTAKKRDLKHKDGELVQITKQQAEIAYKQKRVEVGKAQTLEQLEVIAKARGYKPGWAEHVFEAKQKKQTKQTAAL
jgi:superfamily II DNA or RNA helicase